MKSKLKFIIPIILITILTLFMVTYYECKPRLKYRYVSEYDGYVVDKCFGNSKKYKVKETYQNKPVVGIGVRAFYENKYLEELEFECPENIYYIERLAFYKCKKLKTIDLSHTDLIAQNAFQYCIKLNDISVKAKNIGGSAFYGCENLSNFKLEEGVKTLGTYALSYTNFNVLNFPSTMADVYVDSLKYSKVTKVTYYKHLNLFYLNTLDIEKVLIE
ncbi:MAG: leucine-rich repeat domain-containing protein [Acholeplasmatales bacterium]|nr:leucine-rich repeat domain-containing protein [Acholeplasmatales bacterium]